MFLRIKKIYIVRIINFFKQNCHKTFCTDQNLSAQHRNSRRRCKWSAELFPEVGLSDPDEMQSHPQTLAACCAGSNKISFQYEIMWSKYVEALYTKHGSLKKNTCFLVCCYSYKKYTGKFHVFYISKSFCQQITILMWGDFKVWTNNNKACIYEANVVFKFSAGDIVTVLRNGPTLFRNPRNKHGFNLLSKISNGWNILWNQ